MDRKTYINQVNRLRTCDGFEEDTIAMLRGTAHTHNKEDTMKINKRFKIIIAAALCMVLLTGTVFAGTLLLSPTELAGSLGDSTLAAAFESEDAVIVNRTVQTGEYNVTFLGMVSGSRISKIFASDANLTYAAFAIEYTDGRPMRQEDGCPIMISPLVEGYEPWLVNLFSLSNGAYGHVENNVYYYLFSCSSLEYFADRQVALYAYTGHGPSAEIFSYNPETGEISYSEGYTGVRAVFELDLDESKADPEAARTLLEEAGFELNEDGTLKLY